MPSNKKGSSQVEKLIFFFLCSAFNFPLEKEKAASVRIFAIIFVIRWLFEFFSCLAYVVYTYVVHVMTHCALFMPVLNGWKKCAIKILQI